MDIFYKASGTYNSLTWYVLSEGARGTQASNTWTKQVSNHDNNVNVYDEAGMKALRSYTSTLQSATDHGNVSYAKSAGSCSGNAGSATKLATARTLTIGSTGKSFDGSGNVSWTLSEIGALPTAGGTMTGGITRSSFPGTWVAAAKDNSSIINSTASAGNFSPFFSGKTTNGSIVLASFQTGIQGAYITSANVNSSTNTTVNCTLFNESGGASWPGTVSANTFSENGTSLANKYAAKSHGTHLTIGTGSSNAAAGNHSHSIATSGDWWNDGYVKVSTGGVSEVGKFIDFHNTDTTTNDYSTRLQSNGDTKNLVSLPTGAGSIPLMSKGDTSYWGMLAPDGGSSWIRTTSSGIIPFDQAKTSALGTSSWPFGNIYGTTIYENGTSLADKYAAKSHGTHLTIGTGASNAAAGNHSHNSIVSRGSVTAETGTNRPAVGGLSMSQVYSNGYPTSYGNVLTMKGLGDGQLLIGWSGTSGAHAPVYVRSKRDNADAGWSEWAQIYTSANKPTPADIGAATSGSVGTLSSLKTSAKGNLVAAINEVFQSGSDAKTKLVNALTAEGATASTSDSWDTLIGKISGLGKVVSGSQTCRLECDPGSWIDIPLNLSYKPTNLFVKIGNIYTDVTGTNFTNVFISNLATTTLNVGGVTSTIRISPVTADLFRIYFDSSVYTQAYLTNVTWYATK